MSWKEDVVGHGRYKGKCQKCGGTQVVRTFGSRERWVCDACDTPNPMLPSVMDRIGSAIDEPESEPDWV